MNAQRNRITSGILAVVAATVLACGTIQGASGTAGSESGGGGAYITADDQYGTGVRMIDSSSGPAVAPAADGFGPSLQP